MEPLNPENFEQSPPERPLECSECKKAASVCYTEIIEGIMTRTSMCAECPALNQRLHGNLNNEFDHSEIKQDTETGLCCGSCGTTMVAIRTGVPLGCAECYDVFSDILMIDLASSFTKSFDELQTVLALPKLVHVGRGPGEVIEINPSTRLLALNEALNETLEREDYEQAAWLRDQINAIIGIKESDTEGAKKQGASDDK